MTDKISKVKSGDAVTIRGTHQVVKSACSNSNGNWVCVTHGDCFPTQLGKDIHIDDGKQHRLAWNCHTHGLERP